MNKKFLSLEQITELRQVFQYFDVYNSSAFLREVEECFVKVETWKKDGDKWQRIQLLDVEPKQEDLDFANLESMEYRLIKNLNLIQMVAFFEEVSKSSCLTEE